MSTDKLNKILKSPWVNRTPQRVLDYYQNPKTIPIRYALYSSSLDRFILVDGLDLWAVEHAAKLLSSKFSTIICVFSREEPPFSVEQCMTWALVNKEIVLPKMQMPELCTVWGNAELVQEGFPIDFSERIDELIQAQEFAFFALRASYAMKLTNLFWNSNADLNDSDHSFYTSFFTEDLIEDKLHSPKNKAEWSKNFLDTMGAVVYKAQTISEALNVFTGMATAENFDRKIPIYEQFQLKIHSRSFLFKQLYLNTFFELLGWEPES